MTEPAGLRYLSRQNMEQLALTAVEIVTAIENLCFGRERGDVRNAPKSFIKPDNVRFFMSTLAVSDDPPFMAVKSLGMNETNLARGAESIGSLITLFDGLSGHPLAVMDGDWITAQRTAGLSALAAKHMARDDSKVLAFVGCGVQARSHLDIFAEIYPIAEIRALGRGAANRDALCRRAAKRGLTATAATSGQDAIEGADIVISSVPGSPETETFLDADWLKPGAFVSMVDLARSWHAESLGILDGVFIDDTAQETSMPRPMVAPALVRGDLQDLVSGRLPGRRNDQERGAFVFRGLAIGDLALAIAAYDRAVNASIGQILER